MYVQYIYLYTYTFCQQIQKATLGSWFGAMEAFRVKLDKGMLVATICWETRSVGHPRKRSNFDMPKFGEFVCHA